jgi:NAD(P)-dependent dehydrogenase (short-subunit alcohol dehydrogenase family)
VIIWAGRSLCALLWLDLLMQLQGQVAVVTGGSRGIGKGVAAELARHGARVFVTGRTESDLAGVGEGTIGIRCDHRVDGDVVAAFERVAREVGSIDILVNNVWGGYGNSRSGGGTRCSAPVCARTTRRASWRRPAWSPGAAA